MIHWSLYLLLLLLSCSAQAFELKTVKVTDRVYAIVGEIGPRTPENHALNNTLGFVVTEEGVVLVSSGATPKGAKLIEQAVKSVTEKPIQLVVNIGVQDHHWLGNSYFSDKGISIKALKRTTESQNQQFNAQLSRLQQQIGDEASTISPTYANDVVEGDEQQFMLGGVTFRLMWPGDGHFAGDAVLWLPEFRTLFTGDFVFHDRMLGVHPTSKVIDWQRSFHVIANIQPEHIIPGHGYSGNLDKARRDTGDYLDWLVKEVGKALDEWIELGETVEQLDGAPDFSHLRFYDSWHKRNIHQSYIQFEAAR